MNVDKTLAMGIGSEFKWPIDGIKYLGIQIPSSLKKLYDANYKSIFQNIRKDLDLWSSLPSLLG